MKHNIPRYAGTPGSRKLHRGLVWYDTTTGKHMIFDGHVIAEVSIPGEPVVHAPPGYDGSGPSEPQLEKADKHVHETPQGLLSICYHKCRPLLTWQFFAGITLSYPLEHALWTKVPVFSHIAEFLGLGLAH